MQERIVVDHQAVELADARLREAQTLVHGFINELEQSAVTALSFLEIADTISSDNIGLIREVVNADPFLDQVFVLNSQRALLFPRDSNIHSNSERQFAESLTVLLDDPNAFRAKSEADVEKLQTKAQDGLGRATYDGRRNDFFTRTSTSRSNKINETVAQRLGSSASVASDIETGWTTWDTGTATDIYLWHRTPTQVLVGQKLSSAYWLSQLIAHLGAGVDAPAIAHASIRLVDKRQRTIYQWGNYEIGNSVAGDAAEAPLSKEWLTYPLDGWRLEYYAPPKASNDFKLVMFWSSFLSLLALVGLGARLIWREYKQEIQRAEQRVSFVNQVSHELKTPLTNICLYADMLEAEVNQDDVSSAGRVTKFAKVVTSESQRLSRLINNVLDFSRAQQKKLTVHKKSASVDDLIQLTLNNFAPAFSSKGIQIETKLGVQHHVMLDSQLLEQILNNLFSNVEKYAAVGGFVNVESFYSDGITTILVRDGGGGIPTALRDKIFEPFERGSDSLIEGVSGTGIGLSIARDIARLHGGDISLNDCDKGACFKVTLQTEMAK